MARSPRGADGVGGSQRPLEGVVRSQKPSKYGNLATYVDGKRFASKREAERYQTLVLLERAGEIRALECQPRYPLDIGSHRICVYVADFRYNIPATGETIVEDSKGCRTREYLLKKKLMLAIHDIEIRET